MISLLFYRRHNTQSAEAEAKQREWERGKEKEGKKFVRWWMVKRRKKLDEANMTDQYISFNRPLNYIEWQSNGFRYVRTVKGDLVAIMAGNVWYIIFCFSLLSFVLFYILALFVEPKYKCEWKWVPIGPIKHSWSSHMFLNTRMKNVTSTLGPNKKKATFKRKKKEEQLEHKIKIKKVRWNSLWKTEKENEENERNKKRRKDRKQ